MSTKESNLAPPNKPSPTANTKANRLPAPTLFVGPPSRNTSQLSISRQTNDATIGKPGRDPLSRQKSALGKPYDPEAETGKDGIPSLKKSSEKDIDAKWREMQSTLNDVELTAQTSTHVFGESHAAALDDLRRAQVELARAWGRGNEEKAQQASENHDEPQVARFQGAEDIVSDREDKHSARPKGRPRGDTSTSASTVLSDESTASTQTAQSTNDELEDDTAQDIRLASERRATNEAYFKKVDEGVKDVVARLEVVAEAMRGVESESRSLWSESSRSSESTAPAGREKVSAVE